MHDSSVKSRLDNLAQRDRFVSLMGFQIVEADAGTVVVRGRVRAEHVNFNGTCHGGYIFSLADTAFGLASNSGDAVAIGIDAHMAFTAAAYENDELVATAREISRSRRIGTYEIEVKNSNGRRVARLTGTVYIPPSKTGKT